MTSRSKWLPTSIRESTVGDINLLNPYLYNSIVFQSIYHTKHLLHIHILLLYINNCLGWNSAVKAQEKLVQIF